MTPYEKFLKENDPEQYAFYMAIESGESDGDVITTNPDIDIKSSMTEVHVERQENTLVDTIIERFSLAGRFDESKVRRGQPKNKGQFAEKGKAVSSPSGKPTSNAGSASKSTKQAAAPKPAAKSANPPAKKEPKPDPVSTYSKLRALIQTGELPPPADPDIKSLPLNDRNRPENAQAKSRFPLPEHGPHIAKEDEDLMEKQAAKKAEILICKAIGAVNVGDYDELTGTKYPSYDGRIHTSSKESTSNIKDFVEIKYKSRGSKNELSVHPDALLRKADHIADYPKSGYHVILMDVRDRSYGGKYKDKYKGHDLYYKRWVGEYYSTQNMYRVKDLDELKILISMPDDQLPEKARGIKPVRNAELERKAALAEQSRKNRDADGKKQARRQRYKERETQRLAARLRAG